MQVEKIEIVLFACICFVLMLLDVDAHTIGIFDGCQWWQRLTYQFFHVSVFHLAVNIYVMWLCVTRFSLSNTIIACCYIASALVPTYTAVPTIGASGIVYALLGVINTMVVEKWRYAAWIAVYIGIFWLFNTNAVLHLTCYVYGLILGNVSLIWRRLTKY